MSRTPLVSLDDTVRGGASAHPFAPVRRPTPLAVRLIARIQSRAADAEAGMTTAEYAVGTVAACGFGGVLYKVISSPQILDIVKSVIGRAFHLSF